MGRFVVYIAMSLDGYIADEDGDVHWLEAFEKDEYGYNSFIGSIGSILMGRSTFEQVLSMVKWPYSDIPTLVWSGKEPAVDLPERVQCLSENVEGMSRRLRELAGDRDFWVLGGARVVQSFLSAGLIDRMDIFIVPVLLGGGVRLFREDGSDPQMLNLEHVQPYANGVVQLTYTNKTVSV